MITRWTFLTILLALCGLTLGNRPTVAAAEVVFPARPRLEYTAAELAAWKADAARQGELKAAITRADALLGKPLAVPQKSGDWIFYYACPDDAANLRAETPERHVCPTCGKVFTDERTNAAYRSILNDQLNRDIHALALGYALTGKVQYAEPARAALVELARLYPTFERHDRWGRNGPLASIGGWRYAQMLDEAVSVIELAKAYDLIADAPCVSAADRTAIETNLLGFIARNTQSYQYFVDPINNHRTWFNAGYAAVAVAIGDAKLLGAALDEPGGLLWQLDRSVTSDGIWYEGTIAYHFYALQAVISTLEAAKRAGRDLAGNDKLKSLWLGPMRMTYPDGTFPVFHDSDPASLAGYRGYYQWAYRYFNDPRLAGQAGEAAVKPAPLGSADMSGIGVAALRYGEGDANPLCAMIDYGIHGGAHGHPDKLNLVLYGLGRELLLDPGRITYSVPEYKTWCRTTVAHNTVVIDGKDQRDDTGRLLFFHDTPRWSAALAASDGAYPGTALRRFLLLADGLLIDVFAVRGEKKAQFDWLLHGRGTPTTTVPLAPAAQPLGTDNGYQHLKEIVTGTSAAPSVATFDLGGGKAYRVFCLDAQPTQLATGMGIGYNLGDRVPFLLRRREAASTVFVTVYDLSGTGAVTKIERVAPTVGGKAVPEQDAVGLRLTTTGGVYLAGLDLRDTPAGVMSLQGRVMNRCLFEPAP